MGHGGEMEAFEYVEALKSMEGTRHCVSDLSKARFNGSRFAGAAC